MSSGEPPAPRPEDPPRRSPGDVPWRLVLWGAVLVYAVVFLLANAERQDVNFVFFTVETRLIWLILLSMGLGAALALAGPRWWRSRRR